MRLIATILAAVMLCGSAPAFAQEWLPFISAEDGFSAVYPGQPKVEAITYPTEYRMTLPGRVYSAEDARGRYSTTVIDYRGIQKLHDDAEATCLASKGANLLDGDACQNDFIYEVAGAMDYAAWNLIKQEGVKTTHYMWYSNDGLAGRLVQLTNPDQSRTFAVVHQHAGRLLIHKAVVPARMPQPILFIENFGAVDEQGRHITYGKGRTSFYTEGYSGDWRFPTNPLPPRTVQEY
jgi:hypothetical protein